MRRKTSRIAGLVSQILAVVLFAGQPAVAEPAPARGREQAASESPAIPTPAVLLMLIRTTLVALNQANFTGNYTVLHSLGTPHLQATSSPADLGIAFQNLREQRLDLSPVLVLPPELSQPPSITQDGALRLTGLFRTRPVEITFVAVFRPVAGIWRIEGLSVNSQASPPPAPLKPIANVVAKSVSRTAR
jgi:hypothetical protein